MEEAPGDGSDVIEEMDGVFGARVGEGAGADEETEGPRGRRQLARSVAVEFERFPCHEPEVVFQHLLEVSVASLEARHRVVKHPIHLVLGHCEDSVQQSTVREDLLVGEIGLENDSPFVGV